MKLRIKGNSIRLRLTQSDMALLSSEGKVSERVDFGNGSSSFAYDLETAADEERISTTFDGSRLVVRIPHKVVMEWVSTEAVSIETSDTVPSILVEKDFACITTRRGEDESDMFPNPGNTECA